MMSKAIWYGLIVALLVGCASKPPTLESDVPAEKKEAAQITAPQPGTVPQSAAAPLATVDTQAQAAAESENQRKAGEEAQRSAEEALAIERAAAARQAAVQADPLNAPGSALSRRSVFFPFDVDAIQPEDRDTVVAHGEYLGSRSDRRVRIEGNCDERGSPEYNLGLGQRRAENTKRALILSGAAENQIETVSYGEEKPRCTAHEEACWSQNRRADIVYK